jgi:hypothetical protein
MIWLLPHPLPLSRQQDVSLSQSSFVSPVELTDVRRGEGVWQEPKSYDGKKARSSINYSVLSGRNALLKKEKER